MPPQTSAAKVAAAENPLACGDPIAAAVMQTVVLMPVCQKRSLFKTMREEEVTADWFLPRYGITAGQFCVMQILSEGHRAPPAPEGA